MKLKLKEIKVQSFLTDINQVKGGLYMPRIESDDCITLSCAAGGYCL